MMREWATDLTFRALPFSSHGRVFLQGRIHSGFQESLFGIRGSRSPVFDECAHIVADWKTASDAGAGSPTGAPLPVYVCGHSLGGALALLFALGFERLIPNRIVGVHTFAQPRIGDSEFAAFGHRVLGDRVYRYVAGDDIVPHCPPRALGFDNRIGRLVMLRHAAATAATLVEMQDRAEPDPLSTLKLMRSMSRVPAEFFQSRSLNESRLLSLTKLVLPPFLMDHLPLTYMKLLLGAREPGLV